MKHILLSLFLLCSVVAMATIPADNSCQNPMVITEDFQETIPAAGDYWFTAWTYDLPLGGFFVPDDADNTTRPIAWVDFSCTTGVYDDPLLSDIVTSAEGWGVEVPIKFEMLKTIINGVTGYQLIVDDTYRELLSEYGLTYNVQALIRVSFPTSGKISMVPDSIFRNCMDNATYVHIDDTLRILPNDSDKVFVLPYTDWQNDSVRFIWHGTQPVQVFVAYDECQFTPSNSDPDVWDIWTMADGDTVKLTSQQMKEAMQHNGISGLYYSKVLTTGAGELRIEEVPQKPAEGNAILLPYGEETALAANDTTTLYYFPISWTKATRFYTPTKNIFKMYVSRSAVFTLSDTDENVVAVYQYNPTEEGHEWCMTAAEMQNLVKKAESDYLYVRFRCISATSVMPAEWAASDCAEKTTFIPMDYSFRQPKGSSSVLRIVYEDWKDYGIEVDWGGNSSLNIFFADTCSFNMTTTNAHVITYQSIKKYTKATISAEIVNQLGARADADGYVYIQCKASNNGSLRIRSLKPAEEEPVPSAIGNTTDAGTLSVVQQAGQLMVRCSDTQDVQLLSVFGELVAQWHQQAGSEYVLTLPRTNTLYILCGKDAVVKFVW